MVRTRVTMDSARPTWVLLSYNILVLSPPSDDDNCRFFLDQSDTAAIINLVYQKLTTGII